MQRSLSSEQESVSHLCVCAHTHTHIHTTHTHCMHGHWSCRRQHPPTSQRWEHQHPQDREPVRTDTHPWTGRGLPPRHVPRRHEKRGKQVHYASFLTRIIRKSLRRSPHLPSGVTKAVTGLLGLPRCQDCRRRLPPPLPKPSLILLRDLPQPTKVPWCPYPDPASPSPPSRLRRPLVNLAAPLGSAGSDRRSCGSPPARVARHKTLNTNRIRRETAFMFLWSAVARARREGLRAVFPTPDCLLHPPEQHSCRSSFQDYEAPRRGFSAYLAPPHAPQGDDRRRREEWDRGREYRLLRS